MEELFSSLSSVLLERDLIVGLLTGLVSGVVIFMVGLRWSLISSYISGDRFKFRRIFGPGTLSAKRITVTYNTFRPISSSSLPETQFYKLFPDGHKTTFSEVEEDLINYCSARAGAYLIDCISGSIGVSVKAASDDEVSHHWEGTFINLGTSSTNIKTNDMKHMAQNLWLHNDSEKFEFKDGRNMCLETRSDKGIILKLPNPYFEGYSLFVCAGLGEWGTSGSAWFLSRYWKELSSRFGRNPFLLVVNVTPGSDQSADELRFYGKETLFWKVRAGLLKLLRVKKHPLSLK